MIRLYIKNKSTTVKCFTEIPVPAVTQSYAAESFEHTIFFDDGFYIERGFSILASTQKAEAFVVSADAVDFNYTA